MDDILIQLAAWLLALILLLAMLAAWAVGWWMGHRLRANNREPRLSKFDDAALALFGLLLAFTFGMSIAKHDNRRNMVLADSNAIDNFYTCAALLKEPLRTRLHDVIRDYIQLRLDMAQEDVQGAAFKKSLNRSTRIEDEMTALVAQAVRNGTPAAVPLINTLNKLLSIHAAHLAADRDHLPGSILLLLFLSAIVATMLIAREQGGSGAREVAGTACFILLVGFAVYATLDLNQPNRGLITVSEQPLVNLLSSGKMSAGAARSRPHPENAARPGGDRNATAPQPGN